jgi:hypothetical protein
LPGLEDFLHADCPTVSEQIPFSKADLPGNLAVLGLLAPREPSVASLL